MCVLRKDRVMTPLGTGRWARMWPFHQRAKSFGNVPEKRTTLDQKTIETIVGVGGSLIEDVLKISVPRSDIKMSVDGFEIIPFMGLTSWMAFRKGPHGTTVMGDIVLLEDEISPAISSAIEAGLYVTALH